MSNRSMINFVPLQSRPKIIKNRTLNFIVKEIETEWNIVTHALLLGSQANPLGTNVLVLSPGADTSSVN